MAKTLFRGPVLQGKFNEAGLTGFNLENKSANYTVANADSGKLLLHLLMEWFYFAISIGRIFTFVNTAPDGTNAMTISPNAADGILYAGSLTDNKDLINTKSTQKVGDFVVCASLNHQHWTIVDVQGVFAKEA